jgi:hypothetical protein
MTGQTRLWTGFRPVELHIGHSGGFDNLAWHFSSRDELKPAHGMKKVQWAMQIRVITIDKECKRDDLILVLLLIGLVCPDPCYPGPVTLM